MNKAWDAIEQIIDNRTIEVNVGLSVGFRRDEDNYEEGLFMGLHVEITLDELNTTYSSDVGSGHFTTVYASLGPSGGFNSVGIEEWLAKLEEVRSFDDAQLDTERDHV